MKKTVSINISGVIFHIEEDGYDKLRSYLSSIQQYFSSYEDSQEIVTDIENRVAEKLLAKLKGEAGASPRQVVTLDDVNELVRAMGTVADFEAVQEEEVLVSGGYRAETAGQRTESFAPGAGPQPQGASGQTGAYNTGRTTAAEPRRLVRDLRRKTLGGVAAGLGSYFNIDPVWVRLAFVVMVIGFPVLGDSVRGDSDFFGSLSGFAVLAYIAMWIAFPGSSTIEEDKSVKKFYRNPDDQVLGGVASGIGAYFGIDPGLVRLLFVVGIVFFGVGFLLYIVLWIISPPANTLTEKMEMQGQPITLSNIEHNIKSSLNVPDNAPENALTKVLLFPFRLIAMIFRGLGRALGPLLGGLGSVFRVLIGIVMLLVAFSVMMACLGVAGAALGIFTGIYPEGTDFPLDLIRNDVGAPMVLSAFVAGFLPALGLAVLGIMLITRRTLISSRTALTLAGIWLVAVLVLSATVPALVNEFKREGHVEETRILTVAGTPTFDLNDIDTDWNTRPGIDLKGYDGTDFRLVQDFKSQGRSRENAQANARMIRYAITQRDSVVRFDNAIELVRNGRFRGQSLTMDLFIPYEKPFRMTRDFAYFISNEFSETELERMDRTLWKFTAAGGLTSINFPRELRDEENELDTDDAINSALRDEFGDEFDQKGDHTRQFNVGNFSGVTAGGAFTVRIRKGDTYRVVADGREDDLDDLNVRVNGGMLKVSTSRGRLLNWNNSKRIGLTITVPTLKKLDLSGASQASVGNFGTIDELDVDLSGACRTFIDAEVRVLKLDLSGASKATLKGKAERFRADLTGACKIDATAMTINRASVEASGASRADLGVVATLESETSGASKVTRQSGDMQ